MTTTNTNETKGASVLARIRGHFTDFDGTLSLGSIVRHIIVDIEMFYEKRPKLTIAIAVCIAIIAFGTFFPNELNFVSHTIGYTIGAGLGIILAIPFIIVAVFMWLWGKMFGKK